MNPRKEIEERHSQAVSNEADPAAIAMWDNWKEEQILSLHWDWDDQAYIDDGVTA